MIKEERTLKKKLATDYIKNILKSDEQIISRECYGQNQSLWCQFVINSSKGRNYITIGVDENNNIKLIYCKNKN